jgi:hypothetical protein
LSAEELVAILGAATALIAAVTALFVQIASLRRQLNGRLEQLLAEAVEAAEKRGELAGRDFIHRLYAPPPENIRSGLTDTEPKRTVSE